jgi:hypothetical protein
MDALALLSRCNHVALLYNRGESIQALTPRSDMRIGLLTVTACIVFSAFAASVPAKEDDWVQLIGDKGLEAWKEPSKDWLKGGDAELDPKDPKRLAVKPGKGVFLNGTKGTTKDLISKQKFGDIEAHVEFMIPKGSNSGVKLMGLYEIQIVDSFGVKEPKGSDCGGIYPRAELKPNYHHIDKGFPPKTNACRKAGEWQTLEITFKAPRFDAKGKKTANARFVKVVLNDKLIHENVEVPTPTGHAWREKEVAEGPLLLQADHGPVAFRKVRVRAYTEAKKKE